MATTISDIRFLIEREIQVTLENEDVINWCNQVSMDVGTNINVPSATPATIVLTSTDLEYNLPVDVKIINRLRLQSDIDAGLDKNLQITYRIYNGNIIFQRVYWMIPDTIIADYFKDMTYFTAVTDLIDIADRFTPLYVYYGMMKYYGTPAYMEMVGTSTANKKIESSFSAYLNMKNQVIAYYSLGNEPVTVERRW